MVLITIVNGVYKPTYNWGAPPCRVFCYGELTGVLWAGKSPPKNWRVDWAVESSSQMVDVPWPHYGPQRVTNMKIGRSWNLPSGKRLHNYGKSPSLMGKLTMNGHFQ